MKYTQTGNTPEQAVSFCLEFAPGELLKIMGTLSSSIMMDTMAMIHPMSELSLSSKLIGWSVVAQTAECMKGSPIVDEALKDPAISGARAVRIMTDMLREAAEKQRRKEHES